MKALVKYGKGTTSVELRDIEKPSPRRGELLVKILSAGICGTDIQIIHDEYSCSPPVVLGHEYTGIIEQLDEEVQGFKIGDQIISSTAALVCNSCVYCKQGLRMLCDQRRSIGSGVNGAMAEYMVIPSKLAYKVPDQFRGTLSIAIAEPLACAVRAVIEQSKLKAGDIVLISGPGTIGLLVMQIAKYAGAFVIISGIKGDERRLQLAKDFGADITNNDPAKLEHIISEISLGGVDVAFECSGAPASFETCVKVLKKRGNLAQVGLYGKPTNVDLDKMLMKEIDLTVSFASEPSSWDILMKIISKGDIELQQMISDIYPLDEWESAFERFQKGDCLKILLQP